MARRLGHYTAIKTVHGALLPNTSGWYDMFSADTRLSFVASSSPARPSPASIPESQIRTTYAPQPRTPKTWPRSPARTFKSMSANTANHDELHEPDQCRRQTSQKHPWPLRAIRMYHRRQDRAIRVHRKLAGTGAQTPTPTRCRACAGAGPISHRCRIGALHPRLDS